MKNTFLILLLLTGICISATAQPGRGNRRARVEALATAYITEKLDLTVEEAQVFWPVFNEFKDKREAIQKSFDKQQNPDDMTDAEALVYLNNAMEQEQQILDLKKEYYGKLRKVISVKKVAMLPRAEQEFRRELLKKMRERRGGR